MPNFEVIAAVSETLQSLLEHAVGTLDRPPPLVELNNLREAIPVTPARLTVFLFEVNKVSEARDQRWSRTVMHPDTTPASPPLRLVLRYLVTAWGENRLIEHRLIGRVIQSLNGRALICGSELRGPGLCGSDETLKVTLLPSATETMLRAWGFAQRPYQLSLLYEVSMVHLDRSVGHPRS